MKKFILPLLLVATLFTGCNKEEQENLTPPVKKEDVSGNGTSSGDVPKPKTPVEKVSYEVVSLATEQNFYLNSATYLGFNKVTKVVLPLKVPKNTVKVFYRAAVTEGRTPIKNLRLATQVAGLLIGNPIISTIGSKIEAPEQGTSGRANFYLLDYVNQKYFVNNDSFKYYSFGSRESFKNGIVEIDGILVKYLDNILYLGIQNPRTTTGQSVSVEAIAIIEKKEIVYE